jgi:hypothetical protein
LLRKSRSGCMDDLSIAVVMFEGAEEQDVVGPYEMFTWMSLQVLYGCRSAAATGPDRRGPSPPSRGSQVRHRPSSAIVFDHHAKLVAMARDGHAHLRRLGVWRRSPMPPPPRNCRGTPPQRRALRSQRTNQSSSTRTASPVERGRSNGHSDSGNGRPSGGGERQARPDAVKHLNNSPAGPYRGARRTRRSIARLTRLSASP